MTTMDSLSRIAWEWAKRCFGSEHVLDPHVRALRLLEEAMEYAQVTEVTEGEATALVAQVYGRPRGSWRHELGGVIMTFAVACYGRGVRPEEVFEWELRRVLDKDPAHFAVRNREKIKGDV